MGRLIPNPLKMKRHSGLSPFPYFIRNSPRCGENCKSKKMQEFSPHCGENCPGHIIKPYYG